jgi:hypothetical protein
MEIDYKYELSDQDARSRLDILGKYLASKHGIKVTWSDPNKARFSGKYLVVKIEGELSLASGLAQFRGEDPGFLWRGKAKEYIREKLEKYLDPKTPADQLPTS